MCNTRYRLSRTLKTTSISHPVSLRRSCNFEIIAYTVLILPYFLLSERFFETLDLSQKASQNVHESVTATSRLGRQITMLIGLSLLTVATALHLHDTDGMTIRPTSNHGA